jgi:FkbM family methyltransferase
MLTRTQQKFLKRQRWFRVLFAKPLSWRSKWLHHRYLHRRRRSGGPWDPGDGAIRLHPANFISSFWAGLESDIAHRVVLEGDYEPEVSRVLRMAWRGPGRVVNIGANVGLRAVEICRMFEDVERLYAIEPNPEAYALLLRNIDENKLEDRIVPVRACASVREGLVRFEMVPGKPEYSSMGGIAHFSVANSAREELWVQAKPLGRLIELDERVKLLLVDTEGADFLVLKGAYDFLERHRPTIIFEACETLLQKFGHSVRDLREMLEGLSYCVRRAADPRKEVPDAYDWEDAVAFPAELLPPRLRSKQ